MWAHVAVSNVFGQGRGWWLPKRLAHFLPPDRGKEKIFLFISWNTDKTMEWKTDRHEGGKWKQISLWPSLKRVNKGILLRSNHLLSNQLPGPISFSVLFFLILQIWDEEGQGTCFLREYRFVKTLRLALQYSSCGFQCNLANVHKHCYAPSCCDCLCAGSTVILFPRHACTT